MFEYTASWSTPDHTRDVSEETLVQSYSEAVLDVAHRLDLDEDRVRVYLGEPAVEEGDILDDRDGGWFDEPDYPFEDAERFIEQDLYHQTVEDLTMAYSDGERGIEFTYDGGSFDIEVDGTAEDRAMVEQQLGISLEQVIDRDPMDHLTG